ncbi:MAG TPA: outer membrane beta-barrel protein [Woeseiaceae bacterium]
MFGTQVSRLFLLSLVAVSAAAAAEDLSYNFIQGSYGQVEVDEVDVDGDGFGIEGSVAVSDSFHLFGGYTTADMDFGIELNQLEAGIGYNTPISETVDLVATLSYVSAEVEAAGFGSADDSGYGLGVGLRAMLSPVFEVNGDIQYVDFGDGGDDTGFGAGFLYSFTEQFAAGVSGDWSDDFSSYQLNARMLFGN